MLNDILTLVKERRLPFSVQLKYHRVLFKDKLDQTLSRVRSIKPFVSNRDADTVIHLQVCERDVDMALLAAKSLLHYENNFCIVFHDDGSLSDKSIETIQSHIINCVVITDDMAVELAKEKGIFEVREAFKSRFNLEPKFLYRIPSRINKIFDLHTYGDFKKTVYLDSDIIFQQAPTRFLQWCQSESPQPFFTVPDNQNMLTSEAEIRKTFGEQCHIHQRFNSGFFGFCDSSVINDTVELTANKLMENPNIEIFGDESVWRLIYGHFAATAFPYEEYPLFTNKASIRWYNKHRDSVVYQHFLLKHYHGFYAEQAQKALHTIA